MLRTSTWDGSPPDSPPPPPAPPTASSSTADDGAANGSAQANEMEALAAIFAEQFTVQRSAGAAGFRGQVNVHVALGEEPFAVVLVGAREEALVTRTVKHLLPITLAFRLGPGYPSREPPQLRLACHWLSKAQLGELRAHLRRMWVADEVVLFQWVSWLQEESLRALGLVSPLTVASDGLLQMILDYDQQEQDRIFEQTMCTCGVCFESKIGSQCFRFHRCGHMFCRACLQGYFESQINDGAVKFLLCPQPNCGPCLPHDIKKLVDAPHYARYEALLLQQALNEMGDIVSCPRATCGQPAIRDNLRKTLGVCMVCRYAFCTFCQRAFHGIAPCLPKDLQKLLEQYQSGDDATREELDQRYGRAMLQRALQEAKNQRWITDNASRCPKCNTSVEKISGCNKMTCSVCHTYFCYLCGVQLSGANPYLHFSTERAPCYNRLFDLDNGGDDD